MHNFIQSHTRHKSAMIITATLVIKVWTRHHGHRQPQECPMSGSLGTGYPPSAGVSLWQLLAGQRVGRWWAKVWVTSGSLIISLWIFLFSYFTISKDRNICRNLYIVLFLVALHNQNIAWQWILISSLILSRWDYLILGSLASDCQNNNKNQIQIKYYYLPWRDL